MHNLNAPSSADRLVSASPRALETQSASLIDALPGMLSELALQLQRVIAADRPMPSTVPDPGPVPDSGLGVSALRELWGDLVAGSTMLASPGMIGHMNTSPHIVASLTDALVSQLNNNLVFQELSPLASKIEALMVSDFARRLGLPVQTPGTFCSGGSIANLTALFAAAGGFPETSSREDVVLLFGESAHASIRKAAAILGISRRKTVMIASDESGHMDPDALRHQLAAQPPYAQKIVIATAGSTLHGSVDNIPAISALCQAHGCWLHVDAVYGGSLAFSARYRHLTEGISNADSVAIAPQKWLQVPRLSALVLMRRVQSFSANLDWPMAYSVANEIPHRGRWGIQTSRRADAVTLWVLLQVMGSEEVGRWIDESIDLTRKLHNALSRNPCTTPQHMPDLALQLFTVGGRSMTRSLAEDLQRKLVQDGRFWLSLAEWRNQTYLRASLLNRSTRLEHIDALLEFICER
jgi:glutamate/tyrosine decarboxylase-like PLP-dependent enzyme